MKFQSVVLAAASFALLLHERPAVGHNRETVAAQFENSIGMKLVRIKPGKFVMGGAGRDTEHEHEVEITKSYYLGQYEVTQAQYQAIQGTNPSYFKGDDLPVETVSWHEAMAFCKKLSVKEGRPYSLPTEAEWEFACRSEGRKPFSFGDALTAELANFKMNHVSAKTRSIEFRRKTTAVGSFAANAWKLHDMHGNVSEWCFDVFSAKYYNESPKANPQGPEGGSYRVYRGGSWKSPADECRSARREFTNPDFRNCTIGFRAVLRVPEIGS